MVPVVAEPARRIIDMKVVRIRAPAKLNLGLEILGRRPDGYHEIRTVLAMVDYLDTLSIQAEPNTTIRRRGDLPGIDEHDDLALRALKRLQDVARSPLGASLTLDKRIPASAGLGGASSDAAAALLAGRRAWDVSLGDRHLHEIGAELGTDVPFFLNGPCSLASGNGTILRPLPPLRAWAVIATPPLSLRAKTATLYSALSPSDMSNGDRVEGVARCILEGELPTADAFGNAFLRPLLHVVPTLTELAPAMKGAGAPFVALSGAGGSHYTLLKEKDEAHSIASKLRASVPTTIKVAVVPMRKHGLIVEEWSTSSE
jgi:4-diphosphocytidyl-2-C-methyl-D-erythritol kinase